MIPKGLDEFSLTPLISIVPDPEFIDVPVLPL